MPDFTYSGDDVRYYPSLALEVLPGDRVTLDVDPGDGRFVAATGKRTPLPDPAPVAAPADSAPTDTPEVGN
jgi:hypothetical protein